MSILEDVRKDVAQVWENCQHLQATGLPWLGVPGERAAAERVCCAVTSELRVAGVAEGDPAGRGAKLSMEPAGCGDRRRLRRRCSRPMQPTDCMHTHC